MQSFRKVSQNVEFFIWLSMAPFNPGRATGSDLSKDNQLGPATDGHVESKCTHKANLAASFHGCATE